MLNQFHPTLIVKSFFAKLTGSLCTLVSGTTMVNSHGLLRVNAEKPVATCVIVIACGLHHHSIYK